MKVLIVARGFPQQHNEMMGRFERDQAAALVAAGHDVAYAVADVRSFRRRRPFGVVSYIADGIQVFEANWPVGPMPTGLKDFVRGMALKTLYGPIMKRFGLPDVVHAHFLSGAISARSLVRKLNRPFVVTEHFSAMNQDVIGAKTKRRAIRAYGDCDQLICVSKALSKNIAAQIGFESVVIPNVVEMPCIKPKSSWVERSTRHRFISAGNLIERKRFDLLVEAFGELSAGQSSPTLTIMGDGPLRGALQRQARELGVEDRVRFFGAYSRQEFAEELTHSDTFVLASRSETFGVVCAEAMAMGVPVIATRCGGPEEFVTEECGLLVPVDDKQELKDAMERMIVGGKDYDSVVISGRARSMFSSEAIAERLTSLYECIS